MDMEEVISKLKENNYSLTNNPNEAIYIFQDGTMIDGCFDCGSRGEDHRMIEVLMNTDRYDNHFWEDVHNNLKVVRLVPESMIALIAFGQILTNEQMDIINNAGYEIEEY